jgi:hypothetical protein
VPEFAADPAFPPNNDGFAALSPEFAPKPPNGLDAGAVAADPKRPPG